EERFALLDAAALDVADQDGVVVALEVDLAAAAQVRERSGQLRDVAVPTPFHPGELVVAPAGEHARELELVGAHQVNPEALARGQGQVAARLVRDRGEKGGGMGAERGDRGGGQAAGMTLRVPRR